MDLLEGTSSARDDVDWAFIDAELKEVPAEYQEQRFYPLKHVVEIFSSGDPQSQTAELREREARLSELVDMVVEGYHTGFTRSIQNYSQILTLFQDARQQMGTMRRSINDSIRQLGAHSRNLGQQWQRDRSLAASRQLLGDVQAVVALPARINQALAHKDWPLAVSLVLEACSRLARDEIKRVGALRKLRGEMGATCRSIQVQMCEELLAQAYDHTHARAPHPPRNPAHAGRGPVRLLLLGRGGHGQGKALGRRAAGALHHSIQSRLGAGAGEGPEEEAVGVVGAPQLVACLASLDGVAQAKAYLTYSSRAQVRGLVWRAAEGAAAAAAQSYHAVSASREGAGTSVSLAVPHHVEVLAQKLIQAVADACMRVLVSLASVLRAVAEAPQPQPSAALDLIRTQLAGEGGGAGSEGGPGATGARGGRGARAVERDAYVRAEILHVWMEMQEEWHVLLSQLLHSHLRPLGSHGAQAAKKPGGWGSPARNFLAQPLGWLHKFDEMAQQVSAQVEAALGGEAVPAPALPGPAAPALGHSPAGAQPGAGGALAPRAPATRRLHFTLDVQAKGLVSGRGTWGGCGPVAGPSAADPETAQGYARLVAKALGDQAGSAYLTPAIYLPLSTFVDAALHIMQPYLVSAGQAVAGGGTARAKRLAEQAGSALWLKEGLEDFVLETFLPQIWMDLRARCTSALEHADAFRPPAQALLLGPGPAMAGTVPVAAQLVSRGVYLSTPGGGGAGAGAGRGVVPAARFAERMLQDVATWSLAMPAFEGSFMGVAENILGRMLDSFWSTLSSLAAAYPSFRLAARYDVALSQAQEVDAVLLGPAVCFCVTPLGLQGTGGEADGRDLDVPAFTAAVESGVRPDLVTTSTGRAGLTAVAAYLGSDLRPGGSTGAGPGAGAGGLSVSGLGAELELQLLVYQERPATSDQLMSRGGPTSGRLVALAALGESLEFIADAVMRAALRQMKGLRGGGARGGAGAGTTRRARGRGAWARAGRGGAERDPVAQAGGHQALMDSLPEALLQLVHRCRALSGLCLRTLRLELQLQVAHSLHQLALLPHIIEPGDDAREAPPQVAVLVGSVSRLAEDLSCQLSQQRVAYVLAGLAPAAARMAMWLLPDIKEINSLGVERMVRTLSALQPVLINLTPSLSSGQADDGQDADMKLLRMRAFDRARAYYQLLSVSCEEVVRVAAERSMRFGYGEWLALMQVHVLGRPATDAHLAALHAVLDRAHGLTAGQKIAGAVGSVFTTVIAAPEKVADVALDVLKLGAGGLMAGAMIPARQLGKVFRKLEAVAHHVSDKAKGSA